MTASEYLLFAATGSVAGLALAALTHIWQAWRRSAEIHAKIVNAALTAMNVQRSDGDSTLRAAGSEIRSLAAENARALADLEVLKRSAELVLFHDEHGQGVLYAEAMSELARVLQRMRDGKAPESRGVHDRDTSVPPST